MSSRFRPLALALLLVGSGAAARADAPAAGDGIPGCGTVLFREDFADADLASRGWYDGPAAALARSGDDSAFECRFEPGAQKCAGGSPARHRFAESRSVYLGFRMRFSANWIGSGKRYHPHLFNLFTNADGEFIGPSETHLTAYAEVNGGIPLIALQDSLNVDTGCLLLGGGAFKGCNGDPNTYAFSERRSVAACNGIAGDLEIQSCYDAGSSWYSSREWRGRFVAFGDAAPYDKKSWQHVEVYYRMNSIRDGRGVPDGRIRWVQNGETLIESDRILFRTAAHPDMAFDQLALLPYIFDGSPRDQRLWIDDIVVATARPDGKGCAKTDAHD